MHDAVILHHSVDYDPEKIILVLSDLFGPATDRKGGKVAYIDEHDSDIHAWPEDRDSLASGHQKLITGFLHSLDSNRS